MSRVYAVASAKGGVGKTTTAANLAAMLAVRGRRVVVVDADLGMANLAAVLGVEGEPTLHDVLAGRATVEEATHEGPAGLTVVPGETDLDAFADADPAGLREVLGAFVDYDDVVLDTGAGLSHDSVLPLGIADEVLLVSAPDGTALGDTAKTREVTERLGGEVRGLVLTRVDADDPVVESAAADVGVDVLATVPEDPTVSAAAAAGEPLVAYDPKAPATVAYRSLADELVGSAETDTEDSVSSGDDSADTGAEDPAESSAGDTDVSVADASVSHDADASSRADANADAPTPRELPTDATSALAPSTGDVERVERGEADGVDDASGADGATEGDVLVPDAEGDAPAESAAVDAETPFASAETALVEEAERAEDDAAADEDDADETEGETEKRGFLGRLLG